MSGVADIARDLLGPAGGQLAIAFGAGCAATYTFMLTTTVKSLVNGLNEKKAECLEDKRTKDARIKELETQLLFESLGNNRQRAQKAASETRMLGMYTEQEVEEEIMRRLHAIRGTKDAEGT